MADITTTYGAATAITITAASLANGSARQSAAVENTSNFLDCLVQLYGSSATAGPVYVYVYSSIDGTNYTDGATGSDAAFTMPTGVNLPLLGVFNAPTSAKASREMSVADLFGGVMPQKWGLVLVNSTGGTLGGTFTAQYKGIKNSVA